VKTAFERVIPFLRLSHEFQHEGAGRAGQLTITGEKNRVKPGKNAVSTQ
jgi:hypothetical protein